MCVAHTYIYVVCTQSLASERSRLRPPIFPSGPGPPQSHSPLQAMSGSIQASAAATGTPASSLGQVVISAAAAASGQAAAGLGPKEASAAPASAKRAKAVPTASVAEAARARYTLGGVRFIPTHLLGTVPINRSGLGVSGFHVHEVVSSIAADGLSRRRYRDATVVKVPDTQLDTFRQFNRRMCESDDLLPPFSPAMAYALLTKNHLVHALKLFATASTPLNGTKEVIKPDPCDSQLSQHLSEGVACEVLREELWLDDPDAMAALIGEDNMDAATSLAASEVEVLQTLRRSLEDTAAEKDPNERFSKVIASAHTRFGAMAYAKPDLANLFNFAIRVPGPLLDNLCAVHFAVVPAALLRVRPTDYGLIAKLDKMYPYVKVALIISLYLNAIASGGGALRRQAGGVAAVAPSIRKDAIARLASIMTGGALYRAILKESA